MTYTVRSSNGVLRSDLQGRLTRIGYWIRDNQPTSRLNRSNHNLRRCIIWRRRTAAIVVVVQPERHYPTRSAQA